MTDEERANLEVVQRMVTAYNAAATADLTPEETLARTLKVFDEFYAPEFRWVEAPMALHPQGRSGGRAELTAAAERVAAMASERRYTLVTALASGDRVAAEYVWEGTYREGGANVKIRLATFYQLRDGQFVELHEYPCVEAPPAT